MKQDIQRIMLAAAKPLFLILFYILKIMEVGMDFRTSLAWGYILEKQGLVGILTLPH